jgi:mannose-6-phosphate isomerase-like protein (cupin superfamily)
VRVILDARGAATLKDVSPTFYEELDADFGGFKGCVLIQEFTFDEPWPTWEVHPHGDEIVMLLSGDVDFILHEKEGDRVVRVDQPGTYVVVPRGVWHTARPRARTTMLFFTPGEGTLNAESPG